MIQHVCCHLHPVGSSTAVTEIRPAVMMLERLDVLVPFLFGA